MAEPQTPAYIMGHSDRERERLALQGRVLRPYTERLFCSAGIGQGMHVLDLGCGSGDVSLLLAELVGPGGSVTGVDLDPVTLDFARQRTHESGYHNTAFLAGDVASFAPGRQFDAVCGRHILIHCPDPVAVLRGARALLKPGGILCFQEYDLTAWVHARPPNKANEAVCRLFLDLFRQRPGGDAGSRLANWFQEVGCAAPKLQGDLLISAEADGLYVPWVEETLRTILPASEKLGLVQPGTVTPSGLAAELRAIMTEEKTTTGGIVLIGAWSRMQ